MWHEMFRCALNFTIYDNLQDMGDLQESPFGFLPYVLNIYLQLEYFTQSFF